MQILIIYARCMFSSYLNFHSSLSYSVLICLFKTFALNLFIFLGHSLYKILDSILKLDFQLCHFNVTRVVSHYLYNIRLLIDFALFFFLVCFFYWCFKILLILLLLISFLTCRKHLDSSRNSSRCIITEVCI